MGSESDIPSADLDIMGTVCNDMNQWISNLKAETVCKTHKEVPRDYLGTIEVPSRYPPSTNLELQRI